MRDLRRHLDDIPTGPLRNRVATKLALVSRLLHQQPKGRDKIYALHEPEVGCISKGKARVRYAFGCKVSLTTTLDEGFVVGKRSLPGNPCDGHTLGPALKQVEILTDQRPDLPAPRSASTPVSSSSTGAIAVMVSRLSAC